MATPPNVVTADALRAMPRGGIRRHLIKGELHHTPLRGTREAAIVGKLLFGLDAYVREGALGEVFTGLGFRLLSEPDSVLAPDVSFIRSDTLVDSGSDDDYFLGAPDLAVEVISPADRHGEVAAKVDEYLAAGTRMVLVVDPPRRTVAVHRSRTEVKVRTDGDVLDGGDVVPGWSVPVREVFA